MLYVVGFGSGARDCMTAAAEQALLKSDIIIGYKTYTALMKPFLRGKSFSKTACVRRQSVSGWHWNMRSRRRFR